MQRPRGFNTAQRIVLVVALGVAFAVLGRYLMTIGQRGEYGWFAYTPLSSTGAPPRPGLHPWERVLIWLGLIVVWASASLLILRTGRSAGRPTTSDG